MEVANTKAAHAYTAMMGKMKWFNATAAQEVAMLERLEGVLRSFPSNEAIYEFGHSAETGKKSIQTVEEVLNQVFSRKLNKSQAILSKVGGKVCELRKAVLMAEAELDV